jgi:phenylacetate-coenzyme A ligase PaaK-like adenylate-forming protein
MTATFWQTLTFGAKAIALQHLAARSQAEILRQQRRRLVKLIRHSQTYSPYYRDKFDGLNPERVELSDIPTSNKSELMEHFNETLTVDDVRRGDVERFLLDGRNLGRYFLDKYVVSHTSGSEGRPLLLIYPQDNIELLFALQASRGNRRKLDVRETFRRWVRPARLASVVLKPGFYPSSTAFEYLPEGVRSYIRVLRLSVGDADLVDRLNEFRPTHLTGYASMLHELARQIEQGRLTLKPDLEQVVNISECLLPQAREHYERVFGAPILDDYAMGECLFLSNGCPTSGGMHVNADWAILEVVDEENRRVPSGTQGAKVLITNLANLVQPIIRYEIGDRVTMAAEPCSCGSQLPLIARVEGRDSDMLTLPTNSGVREVSAGIVQVAVESLLDVREYQLVQTANNRVRVLLEPLPDVSFDRDQATRIIGEQLRANGIEPECVVALDVVRRLAAPADGKFKRVVRADKSSARTASR